MVWVIRDAAIGAITLQRMLYLTPSLANVSVKPTSASFAAGRCQHQQSMHGAVTYQSNWLVQSCQTAQRRMQCLLLVHTFAFGSEATLRGNTTYFSISVETQSD